MHHLVDRPDVLGTDLISPATDPSGQWAIEIALDTEGLPPAIIKLLAQAEMTIRDVGPRHSWWHCTVEV